MAPTAPAPTTPQTAEQTTGKTTPVQATGRPAVDDVASCIRRHAAGDRTAMTDLTRLVTPWLQQVVRGYRLPPSTVDDVVQSTLLLALLHVHELRDPVAGLSWLWVVARREALRVISVERRYLPAAELESLHAVAAPGAGPEEIALDRLSRAVVRRTVAKLAPRHRVLLEFMFRSDEPDYETISAELLMPKGSIGPTRRRSLEQMRRLLDSDPGWDTELSA